MRPQPALDMDHRCTPKVGDLSRCRRIGITLNDGNHRRIRREDGAECAKICENCRHLEGYSQDHQL
jgi:hypothetical protein